MKIIQKSLTILLSSSLVLSGCMTTKYHRQTTTDSIKTIVIDTKQSSDKSIILYAIGEQFDYKLKICHLPDNPDDNKIKANELCHQKVAYLQSDIAKQNTIAIKVSDVNIRADAKYAPPNGFHGDYYAVVKTNGQEIQPFMRVTHGDNAIPKNNSELYYLERISQEHSIPLEQLAGVSIAYTGEIIAIEQRDELLKHGILAEPLPINIEISEPYRTTKPPVETLKDIGSVGVGIVGAALFLPVALTIGVACTFAGCKK